MVTSLLTDRRLRSWLSGIVLTTWSWTRSKQWRWSWTSEETRLLPSWTALWLQWRHSGSWAPQFLRTRSGTITSVLSGRNCLVQLSYQIWPQKTTLCSPYWWANHWYNPLHSPRTVLIQPSPLSKNCTRVSKRTGKITLESSHPAHTLIELLPSGRRYSALNTRKARHRNNFFPQAIHLMNTWQ